MLILAGTWSAARSDVFDGALWRSAVAGAATVTALAAAGLLAMWWRSELLTLALWWSLAMAAIAIYCAVDFSAVLAEPGGLPSLVKAASASLIGLVAFLTVKAVRSPRIDLTIRPGHVFAAAISVSTVVGGVWWITRAGWVTSVGWSVVAAIALAGGLRQRDNLAGWFAVGALGVLHHEVVGFDSSPDAIVGVTSGLVLELGLMLVLLGALHQIEQGRADLERRLHAADARVHLLQMAREAHFNESEQRDHEARSALAALDQATRLMPEVAGSFPLRDAIHSEVALLRRLVTPGPGDLRSFLIADALVGTVAVERLYGIDVRVHVPGHLSAFGDLSATAEAVQGLLENARVHAPGSAIDIVASRTGGEVHIAVSDSGPGIDSQVAEQIFERGFTTGTGSGTGLGLGIARTIMERQGGRLWCDGRATSGARFVLALPAFSAGPGGPNEFDELSQSTDGGDTTVPASVHDGGVSHRFVEGDRDIGI